MSLSSAVDSAPLLSGNLSISSSHEVAIVATESNNRPGIGIKVVKLALFTGLAAQVIGIGSGVVSLVGKGIGSSKIEDTGSTISVVAVVVAPVIFASLSLGIICCALKRE
jgi:hypothetical protein